MEAKEAVFVRGPHGWLEARGKGRVYWVAALAGLLANMGFAPTFFFPAYAAAIVVLIWLLDGARRREQPMKAAFARAWVFAFFHFLGGLYWVGSAFLMVDGAAALIPLALIALPGGLALFWGAASAIAIRFWSSGPRRIGLFVLAIMVAEIVRGHLFGGLPWNLAGYVWPAGGEVSQSAALFGIYGLSAVTLLIFAAPATFADAGPFGFRVAPTFVAALIAGVMFGAGFQRLAGAREPPQGPVVRVADAGFTQVEKWTRGNEYQVFEAYTALIDGPNQSKADVVIWPESAMPFLLLDQPELMDVLGARLVDRVLITGASRKEHRGGKDYYYNSGVVLDGVNGTIRIGQVYNKSRLVPFGEFIPFWPYIEGFAGGLGLKALQQIGNGFEIGDPPGRIIVPGAPDAAILICYESIFPGFSPRGTDRPAWLISLTNDAWFGWQAKATDNWIAKLASMVFGRSGPLQHYNQSRYRAIEEGLPMARAASGGVSAIIDAYGRDVISTGLRGGAVEAQLPAHLRPTTFALAPAAITFIVLIVLALLASFLPGGRGNLPKTESAR